MPELELAHENGDRARVSGQFRDDVGQRQPVDGDDRLGGRVRNLARHGECDDDERPRTHRRSRGAEDDRLLRPAAVRSRHARSRRAGADRRVSGSRGRQAALQSDQLQRGRLSAGIQRHHRDTYPRPGGRGRADARERSGAGGARGPPPHRPGAPARRMRIPFIYNVRSVMQRPYSTALTALGIALVVAVFIGMLALANGFAAALAKTGSSANVIVLRRGADSELSSGLGRDVASMIAASPHVPTGTDGRPLVSPEVYVLIPLGKSFDTTQLANVVVRGVSDQAWMVRANVKMIAGQRPTSGRPEVCVGQRLVARFPPTGIGQSLHFAGRDWTVACHFSAAGSAFGSEIWGENEEFQPVFPGEAFQSIHFLRTNAPRSRTTR